MHRTSIGIARTAEHTGHTFKALLFAPLFTPDYTNKPPEMLRRAWYCKEWDVLDSNQ